MKQLVRAIALVIAIVASSLALVAVSPASPALADGTTTDRDGDGIPDVDDVCPDVAGSWHPDRPGCELVARTVTAVYREFEVVGSVSSAVPGCHEWVSVHAVVLRPANAQDPTLAVGRTNQDGSYELSLPLAPGAQFVVLVKPNMASGQPCDGAGTAEITVPEPDLDRDDDGVPDGEDACPDAAGPWQAEFPGCEVVERTVTATYRDGMIVGSVSSVVQGPGCLSGVRVDAFVSPNGDQGLTTASDRSHLDGSFALTVDAAPGTAVLLVVEQSLANLASGRKVCGLAHTMVRVPHDRDRDGVADEADKCPDVAGPSSNTIPGCPTLTRIIGAAYGNGEVVGTVTSSSYACAAAPRVTVWTQDASGVLRPLGTTATSPWTNSFKLLVGWIKPGTRYWAVAQANTAAPLAHCAAASSPIRTA